jgi:hypothetical protein
MHPHKGVVNSLLAEEKPQVQELLVARVIAEELRSSGVEKVEFFRTQPIGQLNPQWVEWLMGLPIGYTDLKCLETAKSLLAHM